MLIASLSAEQRGWGRLALSISTNEIFVGCHARWMMCMDRREREKCMSWVCECVKENCARGCWKTNSVCECARVRVCAWKNLHAHKLEHSEWVRACMRARAPEPVIYAAPDPLHTHHTHTLYAHIIHTYTVSIYRVYWGENTIDHIIHSIYRVHCSNLGLLSYM